MEANYALAGQLRTHCNRHARCAGAAGGLSVQSEHAADFAQEHAYPNAVRT